MPANLRDGSRASPLLRLLVLPQVRNQEAACTSHTPAPASLLPLLPSGPDGVHRLASRGDRHKPPNRTMVGVARPQPRGLAACSVHQMFVVCAPPRQSRLGQGAPVYHRVVPAGPRAARRWNKRSHGRSPFRSETRVHLQSKHANTAASRGVSTHRQSV